MVLYTTHPCSKCLLISEDKPEKTLHNNFIEGKKKKWGWERLNDFPKDTKILIYKTGIEPRPVFNPKVLCTVNNLLYQYKTWIKLKGKVIEEKNYGSEDSKRPRLRSQPQWGVHLCQPLFSYLQIMKIIIPALKIRHSKIAFTIKFFKRFQGFLFSRILNFTKQEKSSPQFPRINLGSKYQCLKHTLHYPW